MTIIWISANDSSLDKSIQRSQRVQRAGKHGPERKTRSMVLPRNSVWRQLRPNKQVPRHRSCTEPGMPGIAGFVCQRHRTGSTHVYRTPTVSQAQRQGDHGGGPQGSVWGSPREPTRWEEGLRDVTAQQNDTSKSKAEPRSPRAIHHRGIWGGGGSVLPEASPDPENSAPPLTPPPSPTEKQNSPEAADAATAGKP